MRLYEILTSRLPDCKTLGTELSVTLNVFSKGHLHEKINKQNNFTARSGDSYNLVVILLCIKNQLAASS